MSIFLNLSFILILMGCLNHNTKSTSTETKFFGVKIQNVDTERMVTVKVESIPKSIPVLEYYIKHLDSSKIIKAFDNISFGLPEKMPIYKENGYSINGINFEFRNPAYYNNFGLYAFSLNGSRITDYKDLQIVLNDIISLISTKYGLPKKINIVINDELGDLFRGGNGNSEDGDRYYKYEWIKNNIDITLGYEIGFRYVYFKESEVGATGGLTEVDTKKVDKIVKTFYPIVLFEYLKISNQVDKDREKVKNATKKRESDKL